MPTQSEKCALFRALHEGPEPFVIPNPWDTGSARILAGLGFKALATTSAGLAFRLGRRDGVGAVSRDEALAHCRELVEATPLPVSADLEKCFADDPEGVADTVRQAARTGLAGCSVEDASGDPDAPIFDHGLAVERVRAAVEAADALPHPFTITARAENFLHGRPSLEDTLLRLHAFQEAGAHVLYAPGIRDLEFITEICQSMTAPVNVLVGPTTPALTLEDLARAGARRISVGGALARVALGAFLAAAREIENQGRFTRLADAASFQELNAFMK